MKIDQNSIAAAAATLLLAGATLAPTAAPAAGASGFCFGGNACKGKGHCKASGNACDAKNACRGRGFVHISKAQCDKIPGATYKATVNLKGR